MFVDNDPPPSPHPIPDPARFLRVFRDRKPRGVISLPGCIAEAVLGEESSDGGEEGSSKKEPRRARVPNGYFGLR